MSSVTSGNNDVFHVFAWWTSVLLLKTILMSILTARFRFIKQTFVSPEDVDFTPRGKVSFDDPDIERIRRAHRNDLENILPWIASTWLWLNTSPAPWLAVNLIRVFAISRIIHTIVYALTPFPQPIRAIVFTIAFMSTVYQIVSTLFYYW